MGYIDGLCSRMRVGRNAFEIELLGQSSRVPAFDFWDFLFEFFRLIFPIRQNNKTSWYLYDHDELLNIVLEQSNIASTSSWLENGSYSWPKIPQFVLENLTILETTWITYFKKVT